MSASESNPNSRPVSMLVGSRPRIGSYQLLEQLGSGGMGSVFRAVHGESGLEVAIKILPRSLASNPTMLQRFLREAKSAEALQDPNIVAIFDRGSEDGQYYIVLEYLSGGDLHGWVRQHGPLPIAEAVEVVKAAARGLQHAAERALIHRDIKPANLLRTADGRVKVTDLGLALQLSNEDERVTRDGTTVGTVDYMAPEQARDSRATSVRSDIYSLGCTFHYLLAGQPPFPGGNVPEKLRRHACEPPPDIRDFRPEASEELAALIQRMLAKKPDRRFLDYEHLLMALEELPASSANGPSPPSATDEPEIGLVDEDGRWPIAMPGEFSPGAGVPSPWNDQELPPLVDIAEEGTGSSGFTIGPPAESGSEAGATRLSAAVPEPGGPEPEIGLEPIEEDEEESRPSPASWRPREDPGAAASPVPEVARGPDPTVESIPLLDPWESAGPGARGPEPVEVFRPEPPPGIPVGILALRGALAVLVLVFLGIGITHLLSAIGTRPRSVKPSASTDQAGRESDSPSSQAAPNAGSNALSVGAPRTGGLGPLGRALWKEPADSLEKAPPPREFGAAMIQRIGLGGAEPGPSSPLISPTIVVQRAAEIRDRAHQTNLRQAFDTVDGTIEIDDDGPFFEHDFRIHGRERLIRAAPGRRPIVVAMPSRLASVRDRPALLVLDRTNLTIEGIDLVVRAADLSANHRAIFLLQGGSILTLRDCTITVDGPIERPLAVAQLGVPTEPGQETPSTVRFERTLVRGPGISAAWMAEGPAEVVVSRSVLLVGDAPVFAVSGGASWKRSVQLLGSIVATAGPVFELAGSPAGLEATPLAIRALGNTLARAEGAGRSGAGLVMLRDAPGDQPSQRPVDWRGDQNRFDGWRAVAAAGRGRVVATADLDALRQSNPDSEEESQRRDDPWPAATQSAWATPDELAARFPDLKPILAHVASPTPRLRAWSLGTFDRLPEVAESDESASDSDAPGAQWIDFDAETAPDSGDLGKYLAEMVRRDTRRVNVTVRGVGWHPFTPIRLAEGVSLRLQVAPPPSGRESDRLVWRPADGARGPALIQVQGADLTILGATFERDARADLKRVIRVDQGRLDLVNCRFLAPGAVETGGGGLIEFASQGTRPLTGGPEGDGPRARLIDCVLISGGDALTVDLGRGVVSLSNCAIASGSSAIVLRPQKVARDRFAADLGMERCTIVSEANLVRLDAWPGHPDGPDRPWLVASHACAFLDPYDRGRTPSTSVLLRAAPDSLARGALVWQSSDDVYDLSHYLIGGWAFPRPVSFPDVGKLWVDLWGPSHVRGAREGLAGVRLLAGPLVPGEVAPGDLIPRPADPQDRGAADAGADLERLGIKARPSSRGRRRR